MASYHLRLMLFFLLRISMLFIIWPITALTSQESLEGYQDQVLFGATEHILFSNRRDPVDPSSASSFIVNEGIIKGEYGIYAAKFHFSNQLPFSNAGKGIPFTFEKASIDAEWKELTLKLGDSYQEIGKGIVLSLDRNEAFGLDNTLQGGYLRYHVKGFEVSGMGGRINSLKNSVAVNPIPTSLAKRDVFLVASSTKVDVWKRGKLGAQVMSALQLPHYSKSFDRQWLTYGTIIEQQEVFENVDFYFEGNRSNSQYLFENLSQDAPSGRANYCAITYSQSPWKIKFEAKDYENQTFDFTKGPSLEEDFVEVTNTTNVSAGRFSAEKRINNNNGFVRESLLVGYDRLQERPFYHPVTSIKLESEGIRRSEVEFRGGYRWMNERNNLIHGSINTKLRTGKGESLELGILKLKWRQKLNIIPIDDDRNIFSTGYNFNEHLYLGLGYEFVPSNNMALGHHFFNVSGIYRSNDLTAKAFIGQTSGGTSCSSGVCRQIPPFSGLSLEAVYSL